MFISYKKIVAKRPKVLIPHVHKFNNYSEKPSVVKIIPTFSVIVPIILEIKPC